MPSDRDVCTLVTLASLLSCASCGWLPHDFIRTVLILEHANASFISKEPQIGSPALSLLILLPSAFWHPLDQEAKDAPRARRMFYTHSETPTLNEVFDGREGWMLLLMMASGDDKDETEPNHLHFPMPSYLSIAPTLSMAYGYMRHFESRNTKSKWPVDPGAISNTPRRRKTGMAGQMCGVGKGHKDTFRHPTGHVTRLAQTMAIPGVWDVKSQDSNPHRHQQPPCVSKFFYAVLSLFPMRRDRVTCFVQHVLQWANSSGENFRLVLIPYLRYLRCTHELTAPRQ
ncbi:hypothetical protein ACRALDRAFT_209625 [Sodiomyces alcalophilus JCM 7366]|uniref:uncharacterized protein n=1 Tax=Sodiomyces alcalophilus JCM 7366 TaxID=591952 RepID=UPI0039B441C6